MTYVNSSLHGLQFFHLSVKFLLFVQEELRWTFARDRVVLVFVGNFENSGLASSTRHADTIGID